MKYELKPKKRHLLRIITPAYPEFNIYSFVADKTTALGPICVATSAQAVEGWDVEVIDENNLRDFGPASTSRGANHELIQKQRPADVVGFYGGLTSTIPRLYEVAHFYKKHGVFTVAGGQHFVEETIPEALSSGIDCIILGEAENTIKELLSTLKEHKSFYPIPGIAYKKNDAITYTATRPPIEDLDVLPLPDFSLLKYANIELFPISRVRGCGMNCEFCTVKGRARYASAERMLEQISTLVETRDARDFFIVDDLFGQDKANTLKLCKKLKEYQESIGRRLNFTVQIRLDKARDKELLKAMREASINNVAIGFESPIDEELKAMNKCLRSQDMLEMTRIFRNFGFFVHGMFIFSYPAIDADAPMMDAKERIRHFKRFIRKAHIDTIQILLPVPLPGTEFRTRLLEANRVYPLKDLGWEYYDGTFPLIEPDAPLTPESMQKAAHAIMGWFYHRWCFFIMIANIFSIPHILFYLDNLRWGWRKWFLRMRGYVFRFGGQRVLKSWTSQLHEGPFFEKLNNAKRHLKNAAATSLR
jgi:radical SAM superfamily enzyme YgiQ (UPF0313 family)